MVTIYAIKCLVNGKAYIGCTAGSLAKRMREHRCLLRAGKHKCSALQSDWKSYGEGAFFAFTHQGLSAPTLEEKRVAEIRWMREYAAHGLLYNEHIISFRPCDEAIRNGVANAQKNPGNRWSPEANEKRRLAQLGKPKGHGAKISATKRARAMR